MVGGLFLLCKSHKISRKWSRRRKICSFVVKRISSLSFSLPSHFLRCRNWHSIARYQRAGNHSYTIRFLPPPRTGEGQKALRNEMKALSRFNCSRLLINRSSRKKGEKARRLCCCRGDGEILLSLVDIESTFPAKVNTLLLDCHC